MDILDVGYMDTICGRHRRQRIFNRQGFTIHENNLNGWSSEQEISSFNEARGFGILLRD